MTHGTAMVQRWRHTTVEPIRAPDKEYLWLSIISDHDGSGTFQFVLVLGTRVDFDTRHGSASHNVRRIFSIQSEHVIIISPYFGMLHLITPSRVHWSTKQTSKLTGWFLIQNFKIFKSFFPGHGSRALNIINVIWLRSVLISNQWHHSVVGPLPCYSILLGNEHFSRIIS